MRSFRPWVIGLVLLWAALVSLPPALAREAALDKAVLAADWAKVAALLEKDGAKAKDPVARLLMGHASLALNRSNNATVLFRSVTEGKNLADWKAWADKLVQAKPASPVAIYLAADAAARSGDFKAAIAGFDRAIEADPQFALALNARGVALAAGGEVDAALRALSEAKRHAPNLADAHASFGTYTVLQGWSTTVSEDGLRAFDSALHLDPTFALAYNGRGCIRFGDGKFEEAAADFQKAAELLPLLGLAPINEGLAFAYASQILTVASLDSKPGMSLEVRQGQADNLVGNKARELRNSKDEVFWGTLENFPKLTQSEQRVFIQKHGPDTVKLALQVRNYEDSGVAWIDLKRQQARQAEVEEHTRMNDHLKSADQFFHGIPTPAFILQRSNEHHIDAIRREQDLDLDAAQRAIKVRERAGAIDNIDQLTQPTATTQATTPSISRSFRASAINLSQSPSREFGFRTRDLELAFVNKDLNKGNWPVMTTFTLGYRHAGEAEAREEPRAEGRRTRGG